MQSYFLFIFLHNFYILKYITYYNAFCFWFYCDYYHYEQNNAYRVDFLAIPLLIAFLTGNRIGASGATQLANALQHNSTLTALQLMCKHDMICAVIFIIFYLFSSSFYVLPHPASIIVSHMGCFFAPFQYHCFTCVLLIIIFRDAFADCIEREPNWSCWKDAAGCCAATQQHSYYS